MNRKGTFLILAAAVMWGMAGLFVRRLSFYGVSPALTVFFRSAFTCAVLPFVILLSDKGAFKVKPRDIWLFAANGVFSIVMFNFCYYKTMQLSTLSVAAVLLYTAPVFVLIMSLCLRWEKISIKKSLAVVLAVSGCALVSGVFGSGTRISASALGFGLLTGFGYALYTVFSNILIRRGYAALTIIFYTFSFSALCSGVIVFINEPTNILGTQPPVYLWAFLMAVFNTVLPYIFYTYGLKHIDASKAPVIATVEPIAATVLGFFYGETLTLAGAVGIVLVISSVIMINFKSGEKF